MRREPEKSDEQKQFEKKALKRKAEALKQELEDRGTGLYDIEEVQKAIKNHPEPKSVDVDKLCELLAKDPLLKPLKDQSRSRFADSLRR